jgi:mono/diheme cytochrome c family protein
MKFQNVLVVAALGVAASGCSKKNADHASTLNDVVLHKTADMRLGEGPDALYARTCGYCHGHNLAPILLGRQLPDEMTKAFVRTGKGAMPAFRPTEITDDQLDELAEWIAKSPPRKGDYGK